MGMDTSAQTVTYIHSKGETKVKLIIDYSGENCPLRSDGSLSINTKDPEYALHPNDFDFTILNHNEEKQTILIEFEYPEHCRFLAHWEGCPPACTFYAPPPCFIEECYTGQTPELFCMHCKTYIGNYESRTNTQTTRTNDHGIGELLPELTPQEADERAVKYIPIKET